MDTAPSQFMSPAEFDEHVETTLKGYMTSGCTRVESIERAIGDLEHYIFEEGEYPASDLFTLYNMLGVLWIKLASAQALELLGPVAQA